MWVKYKPIARCPWGGLAQCGNLSILRQSILAVLLALLVILCSARGYVPSSPESRAWSEDLRTASNGRTIAFAGRTWDVKSGCGMGPGPNCWSDSAESVWVDGDGLHLKIRQIEGTWHSAEVSTTTCTGYGMHRFYLAGRPDLFDKNVVLGLFLYKDDSHEIDIEFARWGIDAPLYNAQYAIQPWDDPGNRKQFWVSLNGDHSTHYLDWDASQVQFKSMHGHYQEPPSPHLLIDEWLYTGQDIPNQQDCLRVHMNLWLQGGTPPSDSQEAEIVVRNADLPDPPSFTVYLPLLSSAGP